MIKSQQLIEDIKKYESEPIYLENFFSKNDIDTILNWYELSSDDENLNTYRLEDKNKHNNDKTNIPQNEIKLNVVNFLKQKINPIINKNNNLNISYDIAFHANKKAYGIHTDSGYDQNEFIYKQGIIPLIIRPTKATTHTILLEQKCYHSSSFPCVVDDSLTQKNIENLNFEKKIPKDIYNLYWKNNDLRKKQMEGFSICYPFEWKVGDTVIWDRSHIHCSSDFEATGVEFKLGLMWISRIEKD